jgi:hypothetical protein
MLRACVHRELHDVVISDMYDYSGGQGMRKGAPARAMRCTGCERVVAIFENLWSLTRCPLPVGPQCIERRGQTAAISLLQRHPCILGLSLSPVRDGGSPKYAGALGTVPEEAAVAQSAVGLTTGWALPVKAAVADSEPFIDEDFDTTDVTGVVDTVGLLEAGRQRVSVGGMAGMALEMETPCGTTAQHARCGSG